MTRKMNVKISYHKTLISVFQIVKNTTTEDEKAHCASFTARYSGLVDTLAPNTSGDSSSFECFRLMFAYAMPWLRWLVTGLSPRRPRLTSGSVHVGYVVDSAILL
jgi:hypothetical protein